MKNIILVMCLFILSKANSQFVDKPTDSRFGVIPLEVEAEIKKYAEHKILWYRAKLCPKVDFEEFVTRGYENDIVISRYNPKEVFFMKYFPEIKSFENYKMLLKVVRWPEENPLLNSYLIKKEGLRFTNGSDTVTFNLCNDYYKYDERFLVYYKKTASPLMISGNVFQEVSYPFMSINKKIRASEAKQLAYFKLAQFKASRPTYFPYQSFETEEYFQFKVEKSLLSPKSIVVRVPKSNPFNKLEVLYYTNDTSITKGNIHDLYKVKYTLYNEPPNYNENLPQITKVNFKELKDKIQNEDIKWRDVYYRMKLPSYISEEKISIEGRIDTVYFHSTEPFIIVVNDTGEETEIINEEGIRYIITGKGERKVIVTEKYDIIYQDN